MDGFTGGCLCGDVRIVASGRPYRVGICHCLDCRKQHGALFHASAIFPRDAVRISANVDAGFSVNVDGVSAGWWTIPEARE